QDRARRGQVLDPWDGVSHDREPAALLLQLVDRGGRHVIPGERGVRDPDPLHSERPLEFLLRERLLDLRELLVQGEPIRDPLDDLLRAIEVLLELLEANDLLPGEPSLLALLLYLFLV